MMLVVGFDVNNVIDRNIIMCLRVDDIGGVSLYKIVWWKVDFGGVYLIYSISILFKNYDVYNFGKNILYSINYCL